MVVVPSRRRPLTSLIRRVARMAAGQRARGNKSTSTRNSRSDNRRRKEEESMPAHDGGLDSRAYGEGL